MMVIIVFCTNFFYKTTVDDTNLLPGCYLLKQPAMLVGSNTDKKQSILTCHIIIIRCFHEKILCQLIIVVYFIIYNILLSNSCFTVSCINEGRP